MPINKHGGAEPHGSVAATVHIDFHNQT